MPKSPPLPQQNPPMQKKGGLSIVILLLIILLPVSFYLGYLKGSEGIDVVKDEAMDAGKRAGMEAAEQELRESGLIANDDLATMEIGMFSGVVTGVNGSRLTVRASLPSTEALLGFEEREVSVLLTNSTSLQRKAEVDPADYEAALREYQEALEAFQAANAEASAEAEAAGEELPAEAVAVTIGEEPQLPEPFAMETMTLGDIVIGESVTIVLQAPVRALGLTEFTASAVIAEPMIAGAPVIDEPDPSREQTEFPEFDEPAE